MTESSLMFRSYNDVVTRVLSSIKVFGTKAALWLFPLFSKEDLEKIPALRGLEFPIRSDMES